MRRSAVLVVLSLVAALGAFAPAAAAAETVAPKIVIIVGATHGATAKYRDNADQIYAEAIKHTPNVVKVYSPNATWSAVKSAVVGANVVIYLGHGNGWPSPYTYDPNYTTKDGFGLNAVAGQGDHNNKYYGEPYIEQLDFAPGALIYLFHLCYAAGNSEPGMAPPTLSVAQQRVDNYGSAFLRAGASAVIADGHSHSPYYLSALFGSEQSLGDLWRGAPNYNGNEIPFDPSRSSGDAILDPDNGGASPSSFYRAIVGNLGAMTHDVIGRKLPPGVRGKPGSAVVERATVQTTSVTSPTRIVRTTRPASPTRTAPNPTTSSATPTPTPTGTSIATSTTRTSTTRTSTTLPGGTATTLRR